jgi:hypothetical protein
MEALTPNQTLVRVLKSHKALSVTNGKYHPVFQSLAQRHSAVQAARNWHNQWYRSYAHSGWAEREIELVARVPEAKGFAEICCWAGAGDAEKAAEMIFASWQSSAEHWAFLSGLYDFWGYAMHQSLTGIWYATGIVGQKR